MLPSSKRRLSTAAWFGVALSAIAGFSLWSSSRAAEMAVLVPPPAIDETAPSGPREVAVLAGGCFWGVQGVFEHLAGVERAVSGYSGGDKVDPSYEQVGGGWTGHAETVEVTFDPTKITYGQILRVYFSVAHDPTELNRQGPDQGTQYRSNIFAKDESQARIARAYIAQLDQAKTFPSAIATRVDAFKAFYPAEDYHQDYLTLHPESPYIRHFDLPKVASLKELFPSLYREKPVLVTKS